MTPAPKWYLPVAVAALLWNLVGCFAYLSDVMLKPEDIAQMTQAQQAMYAARTWWAVSGTAIAVWGGAVGSLGLILKKGWAVPVLVVSLLGLIVQDLGMFLIADVRAGVNGGVIGLQSTVLVIAVALVLLGRGARARSWIA